MHFKTMLALTPLALVAACGSGEDTKESAAAPAGAAAGAPATTTAGTGASTSSAAAPAPQTAAAQAPAGFAICRSCHSVEPGRNGVGPTLAGIVGSTAGDVEGYNFSPALKNSGIVWTRETLDTWLQGPMKMAPGTKMVMTVPDPARRKAIIDYLETL